MPSEFGGSSLAGGHALSVAAVDRRIRAAVAQVPFISGSGNLTRLVRPDSVKTVRQRARRARLSSLRTSARTEAACRHGRWALRSLYGRDLRPGRAGSLRPFHGSSAIAVWSTPAVALDRLSGYSAGKVVRRNARYLLRRNRPRRGDHADAARGAQRVTARDLRRADRTRAQRDGSRIGHHRCRTILLLGRRCPSGERWRRSGV